jgi:NAD(P)-dependent dehydrogenase (short-subunit alcohol dehydrogenase family)
MRLQNKIAIVTGAAGGIGEAAALLFAAEGAKVAAVDLKADGAESTARQIREAGGTAIALAADVSRTEDVKRIVQRTVAELGLPNVLFNNAGVDTDRKLPLTEIPEDDFVRNFEVNVKGVWLMMKHVVPEMIKAGGGSIINTASISAFIAASSVGYSGSKAAVVAMTRVAAVELGPHNIRVTALCPGATATPMAAEQRADMQARGMPTASEMIDRMSVLGRMATPLEQAQMALFLASDESAYVTGVPMIVDGGWTSIGGVKTKGVQP